MRKLFVGLFSLAAILVLGGCANENKLARATAFSMGLEPHQVQVSDISRDMSGTKYRAKINGSLYNCSVYGGTATSFGAMTTPDCIKVGGGTKAAKKSKSCNDLLKAAGKCK